MENGVQPEKTDQKTDGCDGICRKLRNYVKQAIEYCGLGTVLLSVAAILLFFIGFFVSKDLFTAGAGLIAAAAIAYQAHNYLVEKKSETSRFYLEKYTQALNIILENLSSDKPTRRMAWVSAQKIAENAKNLEKNVTEKPDKDFLEIVQHGFVVKFYSFLMKPYEYFSLEKIDQNSICVVSNLCKKIWENDQQTLADYNEITPVLLKNICAALQNDYNGLHQYLSESRKNS